MEADEAPEVNSRTSQARNSAFLTLGCLTAAPFALVMLLVGGDSLSRQGAGCPGERRVTHFLVFQALSILTVVLIRVIVHCLNVGRREAGGPAQGLLCAISYTLCFFTFAWAARFTPTIVWLQLPPDVHPVPPAASASSLPPPSVTQLLVAPPTSPSHCPSISFHLALAYCSVVSALLLLLALALLLAILAGLLHPEFLVITGFLNPENVLIDFSGSEDEEEEEEANDKDHHSNDTLDEEERARQRKAYAISALLGRPLSPGWAHLALAPLGLKSCPPSPQMADGRSSPGQVWLSSGLSRSSSKENLGLSMTRVVDIGNCSPYLRKALDNSFKGEKSGHMR